MLVLSRKVGEGVELLNASETEPLIIPPGGKIGEIHVVDIRGAKARVGHSFPPTIRLKRAELKTLPTAIVTGRTSEVVEGDSTQE